MRTPNQEMVNRVKVYSMSLCIAIVFYFAVRNIPNMLASIGGVFRTITPFIYGFIIAYLMLKPMQKIEGYMKRWLCRTRDRSSLARGISIACTFFLAVLILFLLSSVFFPQLIYSLTQLTEMLPTYVERFGHTLERWEKEFTLSHSLDAALRSVSGQGMEQSFDFSAIGQKVLTLLQKILPQLVNFSTSLTNSIINISMGVIISFYFLGGKETFQAQIKKVLYSLLPESAVLETLRIGRLVDDTFRRYISGQLLDALILGIVTFICMLVLKIPLAFIVSVLVMTTNIIPMIGPFLGGVPGFILILMVDPIKALWFVVLVIVLQQIDGNILAPKIVGDSTGLSGFWVLLAIFLGGVIGGLPAIVVAVPVMSVVYTLVKEVVEKRLNKRNLPTETSEYMETSE